MLAQIRQTKVYARLHGQEVVRQFIKYAIVGVLNVAVFLSFFNLFLALGFPALGANATAFTISTVNSFILNKIWSFRDQRRHALVRQYLHFLFLTAIGLGLNTGVFSLLLIPLGDYGTLGKNAAALGSLPISVIWNFTSYRRWTFKKEHRPVAV